MATHLAAFWENIDIADTQQPLAAALGEQNLFINGDDIRVPDDLNRIVAAAAICALGATQARLTSPSLRAFANHYIVPISGLADSNAEPAANTPFSDLRRNPITLEPGEALNFEVDGNTAAAADQSALVWLSDGPISPIEGQEIHTTRATAAITATAGAWTNGALTFTQDLPSGRFGVVGMTVIGATCVAARLSFRGGGGRPGCIGADSYSDGFRSPFRYGQFGLWGEFETNTPPTLDVLCNDADTSQVVFLDLIRL